MVKVPDGVADYLKLQSELDRYGAALSTVKKHTSIMDEIERQSGLLARAGMFGAMSDPFDLQNKIDRAASAGIFGSVADILGATAAGGTFASVAALANERIMENFQRSIDPMYAVAGAGSATLAATEYAASLGTWHRMREDLAGSLGSVSQIVASIQRSEDLHRWAFGGSDQAALLKTYEISMAISGIEVDDADLGEVNEEAVANAILQALTTIALAFATNTIDAAKKFNLWDLLVFLLTVLPLLTTEGYTNQDRSRDEHTHELAVNLNKKAACAAASEDLRGKMVADLPRAIVRSPFARLREEPTVEGQLVASLARGATVAVLGRRDRWLQVVFADPLTHNLCEAWVWRGSIDLGNIE